MVFCDLWLKNSRDFCLNRDWDLSDIYRQMWEKNNFMSAKNSLITDRHLLLYMFFYINKNVILFHLILFTGNIFVDAIGNRMGSNSGVESW